jgi:hypothetical protein
MSKASPLPLAEERWREVRSLMSASCISLRRERERGEKPYVSKLYVFTPARYMANESRLA